MRQNWAEAAASWSSGKGGEHSSSSCGPRITSTTQVYKRGTQRTIVLYRELGSRERISNVCLRLLLLFGPQKLQKKKKGYYGAKESSMQKRKLLRYYLYSLLFCKAKKVSFTKRGQQCLLQKGSYLACPQLLDINVQPRRAIYLGEAS